VLRLQLMGTGGPTLAITKWLGLVAVLQMQISALPSFSSRVPERLCCAHSPVASW